VVPSAPGIFTLDATGAGQAAAINQNNTINGPNAPAPNGSVISLYLTGEGQTNPMGVDGKPATPPLPMPQLPVTATIAGQPVTVAYAGGAPGLVAGVMQVNLQIPADLVQNTSGPVAAPVVIWVGYVPTQPNLTITVSK
jgi:uncharacterized protein (TIGR03437 family)